MQDKINILIERQQYNPKYITVTDIIAMKYPNQYNQHKDYSEDTLSPYTGTHFHDQLEQLYKNGEPLTIKLRQDNLSLLIDAVRVKDHIQLFMEQVMCYHNIEYISEYPVSKQTFHREIRGRIDLMVLDKLSQKVCIIDYKVYRGGRHNQEKGWEQICQKYFHQLYYYEQLYTYELYMNESKQKVKDLVVVIFYPESKKIQFLHVGYDKAIRIYNCNTCNVMKGDIKRSTQHFKSPLIVSNFVYDFNEEIE